MKRLQIMIDNELDAELNRISLRARMSKAAAVRLCIRDGLKRFSPSADSIDRLAGVDEFDRSTIDDVVVG